MSNNLKAVGILATWLFKHRDTPLSEYLEQRRIEQMTPQELKAHRAILHPVESE